MHDLLIKFRKLRLNLLILFEFLLESLDSIDGSKQISGHTLQGAKRAGQVG